MNNIAFPLTLTLSLGQREQPLFASNNPDDILAEVGHRSIERRGTFPPLRSRGGRGEGRGEAREADDCIAHPGTAT
jgi:hypothetical protein